MNLIAILAAAVTDSAIPLDQRADLARCIRLDGISEQVEPLVKLIAEGQNAEKQLN